jgi:general secretion pathway protein C
MSVLQHQPLVRLSAVLQARWSRHGHLLGALALLPWRPMAQFLLLIYCCHVLAKILWLLMPLPALVPPAPDYLLQMQPPGAALNLYTAVDIDALKGLHLFGTVADAGQAERQQAAVVIEAEDTQLDLLLLGVVVSDVEVAGRAIIAHRNKQELFAVGDDLPGGSQVQLEQVLPGRVIINNAGHYESLWLYEDETARGVAVDRPQRVATALTAAVAPQPPPQTGAVPAAGREPEPKRVSGPSALVAGSGTLADFIKFTPVHADGRVLGYRIAPGRAPRLFQQFGLKKNDVITGVNGISLDDPTKALKVYRQIQSAKSANFELMRDGETLIVEIVLDGKHV